MSLYNYVDTPNSNLICCICRFPFTEPTTSRTCLHTFCAECILRALSTSSRTTGSDESTEESERIVSHCPVDRSPLRVEDLGPADPIVRCLVDELIVECPHRASGCAHTGQRQLVPLHLKEECAYAEAHCEVKRHEMEGHLLGLHMKEESSLPTSSNQEASSSEPNFESSSSQSCPNASLGCPYTGPSPTTHFSTCIYANPLEALRNHITHTNSMFSLLTEQNVLLRHKVQMLEGTVGGLKKEGDAARWALGPWWRRGMQEISGEIAGGSNSRNIARRSHAFGRGMGNSRMTGRNVIFQNVDDEWPIGLVDETGEMLEVSEEAAQYFAGNVVAPLDLGTTLESTLTGLRESMVGLAAGVDSVGRRGEMALATEMLRMGEEMMSIRAQMHGLRMQVHGIIMDRNAVMKDERPNNSGMGYVGPRSNETIPGSITKL